MSNWRQVFDLHIWLFDNFLASVWCRFVSTSNYPLGRVSPNSGFSSCCDVSHFQLKSIYGKISAAWHFGKQHVVSVERFALFPAEKGFDFFSEYTSIAISCYCFVQNSNVEVVLFVCDSLHLQLHGCIYLESFWQHNDFLHCWRNISLLERQLWHSLSNDDEVQRSGKLPRETLPHGDTLGGNKWCPLIALLRKDTLRYKTFLEINTVI